MKIKKTVNDILKELRDENLARSSSFVGKKAQDFDIEGRSLQARIDFSFNVGSSRLADVGFSGLSKPRIPEFVVRKTSEWFWYDNELAKREGDIINFTDKDRLVLGKLRSAEEIRLVEINESDDYFYSVDLRNRHKNLGSYNRAVFENYQSYMTQKATSLIGNHIAEELALSSYSVSDFENKYGNQHLDEISYMSVLGKLEIIGAVKRIEGSFVPYIAFDIFGDDVKVLVSCNFYNECLRFVLEWTRKFPGISKQRILDFARVRFQADINTVEFILNELVERQIITTVSYTLNGKTRTILVYPWFLSKLDKRHWLVERDMLESIIKALSETWLSVGDLRKAGDDLLMQLKSLIQLIEREQINEKEIINLGQTIANFYFALKGLGVIKFQFDETENIEVHKELKNILTATFQLLNESYNDDLWYDTFPTSKFSHDEIIEEISSARNEVDYKVGESWRPSKMKRINDYRS